MPRTAMLLLSVNEVVGLLRTALDTVNSQADELERTNWAPRAGGKQKGFKGPTGSGGPRQDGSSQRSTKGTNNASQNGASQKSVDDLSSQSQGGSSRKNSKSYLAPTRSLKTPGAAASASASAPQRKGAAAAALKPH
jgi:hypothetical protein